MDIACDDHGVSSAEARTLTYLQDATTLSALNPQFRDDPHANLDRLRIDDPVHQDRFLDRVVLTRASDVQRLLSDRELSSDPRKSRPGSFSRLQLGVTDSFKPTMLHMDDPDHRRLRGLVTKAFALRSVEALRPAIEAIASDLLDAVQGEDAFDVIDALARPLPIKIIALMLGVDLADEERFVAMSDGQALLFNPFRTAADSLRLQEAEAELRAYFRGVIEQRRAERRADLISELIAVEEGGDRLSEAEIIEICRILLVAGNLTTRDMIGNAVVALLRHPAELRKVRDNPEIIADVVEEILRFDPPVVQSVRQVPVARTISGCPVATGQTAVAVLVAANHDPELHRDPHDFRVDRDSHRHFSFGGGAHFCLGAPLALAEGQIALAELLRRFPRLDLDEGRPPRRKSMPTLSGYEEVWVLTSGRRAETCEGSGE